MPPRRILPPAPENIFPVAVSNPLIASRCEKESETNAPFAEAEAETNKKKRVHIITDIDFYIEPESDEEIEIAAGEGFLSL